MAQTTAEFLIEQGKAEGIQQGKAEGIQQGKAEGIQQGIEQGKAAVYQEILEWERRRKAAAERGEEFNEPPPGITQNGADNS